MIFLPNKFELYCCVLRNTVQHLIIKNGYRDKYIKNLMKIHKAEALFSYEEEPANIKDFSSEILKAVFLKLKEKNKSFHFRIQKTGIFLINKKLFSSLLLCLCRNAEKIEIGTLCGKIFIKAEKTDLIELKKLLKAINAEYFFERKNRKLLIIINATKTDKKPCGNEKDWEYILNPLSVVNIYLN